MVQKNFLKKKVETLFFFFLGFDPQKYSIKMIYIPQTKIKDVLGYFWESRKSKGHFGVFLENLKQSFWGIFGEIEVDLGYFLQKIKN